MSAFLGPIHIWLYNKIKFQDELTTAMLMKAKEKGYGEGLVADVDARYGVLPEGDLQDIIDETNIHGWLQTQVSLVENRLAYVVTTLLKENQEHLAFLLGVTYEVGKKHGISQGTTAKGAYELLENTLLNGMPCDHVNRVIEENDEKISWEQTVDIHKPYWDEVNGKVKYYYDIREALIKGMMAGAKVTFARVSDQKYVLC